MKTLALSWTARAVGVPLEMVERIVLGHRWRTGRPQLFILGLPRSGTTLVYQYLVHRLRVAYFTSGVGLLPSAPCIVSVLQRHLHGPYVSDFQSRYGKIRGAGAPREGGDVWGRFFDLDAYAFDGDLDGARAARLRRTIECIQICFGNVAFVNKNVKHMLRLHTLADVFPNASFLVVERDYGDVALSILDARKQAADPTSWWSVRPPNYEELRLLPVSEQVAGQVISLHTRLEQDLALLPAERVLRVAYEDFCGAPESLVSRLSPVLGATLQNREAGPFEVRRRIPVTAEELGLVEAVAASMARAGDA